MLGKLGDKGIINFRRALGDLIIQEFHASPDRVQVREWSLIMGRGVTKREGGRM